MPDDPAQPPITRYQLLGVLARGCGEAVYRARHVPSQRDVAIKILESSPPAPAAAARLRHEAEVLARLDHPNVVPLDGVGELQGRPFLVMKLIDGDSLRQHLPQFFQDPSASAWLLAAVARAVDHVHQRGFVHRDLHPDSILLDPEGQPYLIGFSSAERITPDTGKTPPAALVGRPMYMAPEQALGKNALTPAADVYALGVILYELLTGRAPFQGQTLIEILHQLIAREPERLRSLNPDIDPDLEAVCLKCLRKEPGQRYASAAAVADDLERWLKGEAI